MNYQSFMGRSFSAIKTTCCRSNKALAAIFSASAILLSASAANAGQAITEAEALTFAYVADFSSGIDCAEIATTGDDCRIKATTPDLGTTEMQATTLVKGRMKAGLAQRSLTDWEIVWGPIMQWEKGTTKKAATGEKDWFTAAGTMVVFQKGSTFVVGIAGTNPISTYGWDTEDFDVTQQVPWPDPITGLPVGEIAAGTAEGLNLLLTMGTGPYADPKLSLLDYLQTQTAARDTMDVVVGHSLGGTLSPVLATALIASKPIGLSLKWHDLKKATPSSIDLTLPAWDPNNVARVSTTFFAGATPGDSKFANYTQGLMPSDHIQSVYGQYDIVPRGWDKLGTKPSSTEAEKVYNAYARTYDGVAYFCHASGFSGACPYTKTTPETSSSNLSNVICPCLDVNDILRDLVMPNAKKFTDATAVGETSGQRKEIQIPIGNDNDINLCPSAKGLVEAGIKDEFMIQAIYQHDCSYPLVYPETANLSENFSEIRKQYMFDTNQ